MTLKGIDGPVVPFVYFDYSGSECTILSSKCETAGDAASQEVEACTQFLTSTMHLLGESDTYPEMAIGAVLHGLEFVQNIATLLQDMLIRDELAPLRRCLADVNAASETLSSAEKQSLQQMLAFLWRIACTSGLKEVLSCTLSRVAPPVETVVRATCTPALALDIAVWHKRSVRGVMDLAQMGGL